MQSLLGFASSRPCIGIVGLLTHPAPNTIRLLCSLSSRCRIWLHKGERIHSVGFCSAFATGMPALGACVMKGSCASVGRTGSLPLLSCNSHSLPTFAIEKVSSTRNQSWECGPTSYCSTRPPTPTLRVFVIKKVSTTGN